MFLSCLPEKFFCGVRTLQLAELIQDCSANNTLVIEQQTITVDSLLDLKQLQSEPQLEQQSQQQTEFFSLQ